jgi:hypothetical protein
LVRSGESAEFQRLVGSAVGLLTEFACNLLARFDPQAETVSGGYGVRLRSRSPFRHSPLDRLPIPYRGCEATFRDTRLLVVLCNQFSQFVNPLLRSFEPRQQTPQLPSCRPCLRRCRVCNLIAQVAQVIEFPVEAVLAPEKKFFAQIPARLYVVAALRVRPPQTVGSFLPLHAIVHTGLFPSSQSSRKLTNSNG